MISYTTPNGSTWSFSSVSEAVAWNRELTMAPPNPIVENATEAKRPYLHIKDEVTVELTGQKILRHASTRRMNRADFARHLVNTKKLRQNELVKALQNEPSYADMSAGGAAVWVSQALTGSGTFPKCLSWDKDGYLILI